MLARFENLPTFVRDKRQGFFGNFDCRVGKPHQTSGKQRCVSDREITDGVPFYWVNADSALCQILT